jgi:hypothetical protein
MYTITFITSMGVGLTLFVSTLVLIRDFIEKLAWAYTTTAVVENVRISGNSVDISVSIVSGIITRLAMLRKRKGRWLYNVQEHSSIKVFCVSRERYDKIEVYWSKFSYICKGIIVYTILLLLSVGMLCIAVKIYNISQ